MANYQTLFFDLAAGDTTTQWFRLLGTSTDHERAIHGTLTTGDTITIQMTNENLTTEKQIMQTALTTTSFAASDAQTTTPFSLTYKGAFKWVRIVKTGTTGVAHVAVEC